MRTFAFCAVVLFGIAGCSTEIDRVEYNGYTVTVKQINQGAFSSFEYYVDAEWDDCACGWGDNLLYMHGGAGDRFTGRFVGPDLFLLETNFPRIAPDFHTLFNLSVWDCRELRLDNTSPINLPVVPPRLQQLFTKPQIEPRSGKPFALPTEITLHESPVHEFTYDLRLEQPEDRYSARVVLLPYTRNVWIELVNDSVLAVHVIWLGSDVPETIFMDIPNNEREQFEFSTSN